MFISRKRFEYEVQKRMAKEREVRDIYRSIHDLEERLVRHIERLEFELETLKREARRTEYPTRSGSTITNAKDIDIKLTQEVAK